MNTPTRSRSQLKAFPPAPSLGWLWPLGLAGVLAYNAVQRVATDMSLLSVAIVALLASLSVWMVAIAFEFRRLTYEVDADGVTLRYGRLVRHRIQWDEMAHVTRTDLRFMPWASVRFPGLALYDVPYRGDGIIRMCATRSHRDVLILKTRDGRRYGCTPADPEKFLAAIGQASTA